MHLGMQKLSGELYFTQLKILLLICIIFTMDYLLVAETRVSNCIHTKMQRMDRRQNNKGLLSNVINQTFE